MRAAVIAGTWAAHLYVWMKESINMFLILSEESNNLQNFYQNENVKSDLYQLISNVFQLLDSIQCKILNVLLNTVMTSFLF